MNLLNLRNFNPLATCDGRPTSKEPVTIPIAGHTVEIDLTEPGNQAARKMHDSVTGIPHKIGEIADLLVGPPPSLEASSDRAGQILHQALTRSQPSTTQSSAPANKKKMNSVSSSGKIVQVRQKAPTSLVAAKPVSTTKSSRTTMEASFKKENISGKIQNFVPFQEKTIDSDDED